MTPIAYLPFVIVFVVVPVAILTILLGVRRRFQPFQVSGTVLLAGVALVYTFPWDGQLIRLGIWDYGSTLVGRLGVVPYEELLFIVAQTVLTGLWTTLIDTPDGSGSVSWRPRVVGVLAGGAIGVAGLALLSIPAGTYLGAILVWAAPVLALQWGFGWPVLLRRRRTVAIALAVPTVYLWVVDRLAIEIGLWTFSATQTTGFAILGLPIEEALFFLVTNAFLVQGLVLLGWVVERDAISTVTDVLDTTVERAE
ncbi:lycopene cyclase domain protein [Halorhabdus utahensis DSM 12940]|uniref:Lycopene cyclase domain protein n=1 Tax=Halorhabdus utahensis (strain DSM 12940 / JCM 11049 / AX-2) TaxID=519442 RepID=C7NQP4_HALUD|nr:lycopene cyclase domain-containing protein [Halorhabdus utahensis]ACV10503.1 lycopene cyclase domain protein [Halorhabdus utahensis DSM 12940]